MTPSNHFGVNAIIFRVCSNESHKHPPLLVFNLDNQPIRIAFDINRAFA